MAEMIVANLVFLCNEMQLQLQWSVAVLTMRMMMMTLLSLDRHCQPFFLQSQSVNVVRLLYTFV